MRDRGPMLRVEPASARAGDRVTVTTAADTALETDLSIEVFLTRWNSFFARNTWRTKWLLTAISARRITTAMRL